MLSSEVDDSPAQNRAHPGKGFELVEGGGVKAYRSGGRTGAGGQRCGSLGRRANEKLLAVADGPGQVQ